MKEFGSEFWSTPISSNASNIFPEETAWFLSGRSALTSIIDIIVKNNHVHSVSLPSWCCDSIIIPFLKAGIHTSFYSVFGAEQHIDRIETDILLVMDYFGYTGFSKVPLNYHGIVIRDMTHSIFSKKYSDADFYFGSLRKWCGIWTGGFAWSNEALPNATNECRKFIEIRKQAMLAKEQYICGTKYDKEYLKDFNKAEEILDNLEGIYAADQRDIDLALKIDIKFIQKKRRENAMRLIDAFSKYCIFPQLKEVDCPLFVPIRVANREELRKKLIERQIFCPVHWPLSDSHTISEEQLQIYKEEISLICDQRYGEDDIAYMIDVIQKEIEKLC